MALKDSWIEVPFHVAFEKGLFLLGNVEPFTKFQKDRNAPIVQEVDLDRDGNGTGKRLWKATVMDPSAPNAKQAGFDLVFVADVMPVPAAASISPGVTPIELEGLTVKPKLIGAGEFKSIGWSIRATGIRGDANAPKVNGTSAKAAA